MKVKEVSFAERMFSGSELEVWSFHPSEDGRQLGIWLASDGGLDVRVVVPWPLLASFAESARKALDECEARLSPQALPEKYE